MFETIEPREAIPLSEAQAFDCRHSKLRAARESKGTDYKLTTDEIGPCCGNDEPCC